jgi:transposase
VRDAANAVGVGRSTMDRWVKELRAELDGTATHPTPITTDQQKIKALEVRIKRLEMEKEILKKATALLMSDSPSNF